MGCAWRAFRFDVMLQAVGETDVNMIRRVDLAHEADFAIGGLRVHPSTRELSRDGDRAVIEPRVMQVLVALHRAGGAVVSKDDLALSCWGGRVVGEDAINRVMSRLRKLTDGIAAGAFRIETVTRVGYRLIPTPGGIDAVRMLSAPNSRPGIGRRTMLAAGGVVVLAGGTYWWLRDDPDALPPQTRDLASKGWEAVLYGTPEQTERGISLLQQATKAAPDSALLWGRLSVAYGQQAQQSRQADHDRLMAKARSASERALALDPRNPEGQIAKIFGANGSRQRAHRDRALRALLADRPDSPTANRVYAFLLSQTGRNSEALPRLASAVAAEPHSPQDGYALAQLYWCANRLDEADAEIDRAFAQWPRHYGVWFSRYKYLAYTGRVAEARAMLLDLGKRPTGVPEANFALNDLELTALSTLAPQDVTRAAEAHAKAARTGVGFTQNAMIFAAATGNRDTVFALADAHYFDRGFSLGQQRYTSEQGLFSPARRRPTFFLFQPPFASCWRDPRFDSLVGELGLKDFWRETGSTPDYLRRA